jgi:hypothetical protein
VAYLAVIVTGAGKAWVDLDNKTVFRSDVNPSELPAFKKAGVRD